MPNLHSKLVLALLISAVEAGQAFTALFLAPMSLHRSTSVLSMRFDNEFVARPEVRRTRTVPAELEFKPLLGKVTPQGLARAVAEFERKDWEADSDDMLLATGVPLLKFLRSNACNRRGVVFEARFPSDCVVDAQTLADIFLIKLQLPQHETAVSEVQGQLGSWCLEILERHGHVFSATGGETIAKGSVRRPDTGLLLNPDFGSSYAGRWRLLVEGELRSPRLANEFCLRYFDLYADLQFVLLLKIYKRKDGSCKAGFAVLYKRTRPGQPGVEVADAVTFGSGQLRSDVYGKLEQICGGKPDLPRRATKAAPIRIEASRLCLERVGGGGAPQFREILSPLPRDPTVDLFLVESFFNGSREG